MSVIYFFGFRTEVEMSTGHDIAENIVESGVKTQKI
jgi:hypothetical protein